MTSLIPVSDPRQTGLIFAYLAVRPRVKASPDISVDYIQNGIGDLPSKLRAQNQCAGEPYSQKNESAGRWKVLVGFYTESKNWKRKIKPKWAQHKVWEVALLSGVRLAHKYGVDNIIYIASEAKSSPKSLLLSALQRMSYDQGMGNSLKICKHTHQKFWKTILSPSFTPSELRSSVVLKAF